MCVCVCARSDLKRVPVPAQRLSSCIMCTDEQTVHNKLENLWTDIQETQYYRILQKRVEPFETRLKSNKNNAQVTCKHRCRAHPVKLITYLPQPPSPPPKKNLKHAFCTQQHTSFSQVYEFRDTRNWRKLRLRVFNGFILITHSFGTVFTSC